MSRGSQRSARLGQVFLADPQVERRVADAVRAEEDDVVVEIGAGPGNMTAILAHRVAKVIAVEIDAGLAASLREKFANNPRVEIREADILQVNITRVAEAAGRARVRVFGNLPYYITSPCLLHLFQHQGRIDRIVVMTQLEVARRITARAGTPGYGLLSVTCQYYSRPELLFTIPPGAFRNPPQVHSALLRLDVVPQKETLGISDEAQLWRWLRAAFAQKRKTLVNNWKGLADAARVRAAMQSQGVPLQARAEALSLRELVELMRLSSTGAAPN